MLGLLLSAILVLDTPQDDPVMQARFKRAQAMGIDERDLPAIPKVIVEPPPLPPILTSPKDMKGYRGKHSRSKSKKRR